MGKARASLEAATTDAEDWLSQVETSPEKENLHGATTLVKNRLAFALSVLDTAAATDLDKLVDTVRNKSAMQPCKLWMDLTPLPLLEEKLKNSFDGLAARETCDKEMIAEAVKAAAQWREPIQDLAKSLAGAAKDLKTAKTTREKMVAGKAKAKGAGKGAGGKGPDGEPASTPGSRLARAARMAKPIFEFCSSYGEDVRTFRSSAELAAAAQGGDLDCTQPFVLCDGDVLTQAMAEAGIKGAVDSFRTSWATSAVRANPGRGLLRLKDETISAAALCVMSSQMGKFRLPVPESAKELGQSLSSCVFAVAIGNEAAYFEQSGLPALRLSISGSRVVCMSEAPHAAHVLEVDMTKPQAFARLSQAILAATQAKVASLGSKLRHATIAPGDVLFTPMGWVVCESSGVGGGPRACSKDARGSAPVAVAKRKQ